MAATSTASTTDMEFARRASSAGHRAASQVAPRPGRARRRSDAGDDGAVGEGEAPTARRSRSSGAARTRLARRRCTCAGEGSTYVAVAVARNSPADERLAELLDLKPPRAVRYGLSRAAARACAKSASRSSACSRPTETRTRPSVMPRSALSCGVSPTCVDDAGWVTSVSGPPSVDASCASCTPSTNWRPASRPPRELDREHRPARRHLPLGELALGVRVETGVAHVRRPRGASRANRRGAMPCRSGGRSRTGSVRMPRRPFSASNGDAHAP